MLSRQLRSAVAAEANRLRMTTEPRHCGNRLQDEDREMQDCIVDEEEDDDEEAVGAARKPAARRRMALSDDEDD